MARQAHHHPRHVLRVLLLLLVVQSAALASWLPTVQAQPVATPQADGPGSLRSMLSYVPASLPGLEEPERAEIAYADLAAQFDALNIERPASVADESFARWIPATRHLPLPRWAATYLGDWRADYGFDVLQADQTLEVTVLPWELTLFRGRFDEQAVTAALERLGYEPQDTGGTPVLSLRGDYQQDPRATTAYKFAGMNHAVILEDGTLAFASVRAVIAGVVEVAAGHAPSLTGRDDVAALLAQTPPGLSGALIVPGQQLTGWTPPGVFQREPGATPDLDAIATTIAGHQVMPPVALALLGTTPGGPLEGETVAEGEPGAETARLVIVLLMPDTVSAELAAIIVEHRLATESSIRFERPFAELFPEPDVGAVPGAPVVLIELTYGERTPRNILLALLANRDLGFIAW